MCLKLVWLQAPINLQGTSLIGGFRGREMCPTALRLFTWTCSAKFSFTVSTASFMQLWTLLSTPLKRRWSVVRNTLSQHSATRNACEYPVVVVEKMILDHSLYGGTHIHIWSYVWFVRVRIRYFDTGTMCVVRYFCIRVRYYTIKP